ncbi:putative MYB DNA-binding domain-containing protein [Rosellinia necatrix]|uniref:Putative MYB DNA-binding domain-containing protein n=1 Tax=Rosellinia necatrix TaxID=77044 RepID=A0A1S7UKN1_ROSNE|nr:putative MYB DNA-binding domain-containing protein [Rosellinia necatrix]
MVAGTVSKRGVPPHLSEAPAKKQSKWSSDEDALIIDLRGSGMKWEDISKRLPGRSAISCRLHYQNYLERRSEWDEERKNKLARLYERFKPEMWAKVAEEMAIPWRAAEAMHWHLGEQDMARRAGVTPFSLSTQTLETAHGGSRASSRHVHSSSQGGVPREASHGRGGYSRGTALPPARPLASRRESLPTHHLPPPSEHHEAAYGYSHAHSGGHLAPIHTQNPPPRPGMLPSVAELTTGVSPYSTPAYSVGVPSASPVHSTTASPVPYMPPLGYPPLEPALGASKRRRSPDGPPYETSRRRHLEPPMEPYEHPHSRR